MKLSEEEYKKFLKIKLENVLRGAASQILGDYSTTTEDKKIYMKAVEEMKNHIDNLEKNKEFFKEYNERLEDDLR